MTRTYSRENDDFAALIDHVDKLQQELCAQVRPGVDYTRIHAAAHLKIGRALNEVQLISVPGEDAVDLGLTRVFFPHGVGHLLGLQVHDVGGWTFTSDGQQKPPPTGHECLRLTRTLEAGFVVTIEPGLYFINILLDQARRSALAAYIDWERVERLIPYGGIRIEDNVACTSLDSENITRRAFVGM